MELSKVISLFEGDNELNELITAISYNGDADSFKLTLEYFDRDSEELEVMYAELFEDGGVLYSFKVCDSTIYYLPEQFANAITTISQIWVAYMSIGEEKFDTALEYLGKIYSYNEE